MIQLIDLLLYSEESILTREELLKAHQSNLNYFYFLDERIQCEVIQHAGFSDQFSTKGISFTIYKSENRKWKLYLSLCFKLRKKQPDVILIHSFIYAWQIIVLRLIIGSNTKIIVQNHAEKPFNGIKKYIQKIADNFVSAYLFVSKKQSHQWFEKGIISDKKKIHEVMEGSTLFSLKNKLSAKDAFNCSNKTVFLWVGRLDKNKDPLTILNAFHHYVLSHPEAKLWMIYSTTELLNEVKSFVIAHNLTSYVDLIGEVNHEKLEDYYNAADYFILGSHDEGSGYALCEAMVCGCVPIVTAISSFTEMLNNGRCGYLFEAGNSENLYHILMQLKQADLVQYKEKTLKKFNRDLSHEAIGRKLSAVIDKLCQK